MLSTFGSFIKKEQSFKVGGEVFLTGKRFERNIYATIKELDNVNEIAIVTAADDTTYRVDYDEMKDVVDVPDLQMNSIKDQTSDEYRPIGKGYGKDRDAWNVVASAMKRVEKELGKSRVPITAVKYQSTTTDKWHNGFNTLWDGDIKFTVDFMGASGEKRSATVSVPIKNGIVQQAEYIYDNLNRKYELNKEGVQNFLDGINNTVDENKDESIFETPGKEDPTVVAAIAKNATAEIKSDLKEKLITAQNSMGIARKIMNPNDFENFRKLMYLRDMIQGEIEKQQQHNKLRGVEKNENLNYERLENVNRDIDNILENYRNQLSMTFQPSEAKDEMINKILKKATPPEENEQQDGVDSKEVVSVDENGNEIRFKKKETQQKKLNKRDEDEYNVPITPVPSGTGNRDVNDKSMPDPHVTRFSA